MKDRFEILYLSCRQLSKGFQKIAHFVMGDIFIILIAMIGFLKNWSRLFFPNQTLVCGRWCLGILETSVCVLRGLTLETQEPHQKQKRLLTFFFFLLPPFLLPYDDGLFFSSYSISLFGLSSFMSLDRLHSLRGSGFTISFCLGGNDKIIQGRIG